MFPPADLDVSDRPQIASKAYLDELTPHALPIRTDYVSQTVSGAK
jgi:hypothetical protein